MMKTIEQCKLDLAQTLKDRYGTEFEIPAGTNGLPELLRIASQASHRAWSDQAVAPELVRLLVACALSAPSKSYLQQADVIDVRDVSRRMAIQALVPAMPWMANAPVFLIFCGNGRRFQNLFKQRGMPFANDHLDAFFNPVVDAALVMMNFINAAQAVGLVSCPISMIRNHPEELSSILELPDRVVPVVGLCVGYPAQHRSVNPRLSLDASFHIDRMGSPDDASVCHEFDARYIQARKDILANADLPIPPPINAWSDERVDQYKDAQREDWGRFVRSKKFDLR